MRPGDGVYREWRWYREMRGWDWLLLPWQIMKLGVAYVGLWIQSLFPRRCGGRHVDWSPEICPRCLWMGPTRWLIHTYTDDGSGEDVVVADECPRCPACNCAESRCVYTRPIAGRIRRCRECRHCGRRFYTWESPSTQVPRQMRGQS